MAAPRGVILTLQAGRSALLKNDSATRKAKSSEFPEKFKDQLLSNFMVALIKQVVCTLNAILDFVSGNLGVGKFPSLPLNI